MHFYNRNQAQLAAMAHRMRRMASPVTSSDSIETDEGLNVDIESVASVSRDSEEDRKANVEAAIGGTALQRMVSERISRLLLKITGY